MCCVSENFRSRKASWIGGGSIKISRGSFFPHSAENFRRGSTLRSFVFSGVKKVCVRGGGGVSKISVESYLSHSAKNFRRGESFSASFFFGYQKKLCFRGLCHDFRLPVA